MNEKLFVAQKIRKYERHFYSKMPFGKWSFFLNCLKKNITQFLAYTTIMSSGI